ncbi:MAG: nucleoside phosphorylase [Oscillospiraceae bacterium]|nr:nucleoside phosphorylase [Oscillospiraceae bacterium]
MAILKKEFPILEFDEDRNAFIRPEMVYSKIDISERAVICFFADAIEKVLSECEYTTLTKMRAEGVYIDVNEINYKGEKIALVQALVGAPMAAGMIDQLTALGCSKYIACGGCGVLQKELAVGHLIIPTSAVRDEGTSYHYIPPAREVSMDERAVEAVESALSGQGVSYVKAKTWTTDAFYRETPAKIALRKEEGCATVEMEASAFTAAAQYNGVQFGQILYAGDTLAEEEWDKRGWHDRSDIREYVLKLALDACLEL